MMALTVDCREGRHAPICIGHGPNAYAYVEGDDQRCACWCHDALSAALEDVELIARRALRREGCE